MARSLGLSALMLFLIVFLQNFDLLNARVISPVDPSDIRVGAPEKPVEKITLAQPQSGSDLNSIGADWAGRQAHLLANGADDRLLTEVNSKLDQLFGSPVEESASVDGDPTHARRPANSSAASLKPKSIHMARLGQIEVGFQGDTKLSCEFNGASTTWDLSHPLASDVDVRLHHDTRDAASTLLLHVSW